jgi:hypothetical protein
MRCDAGAAAVVFQLFMFKRLSRLFGYRRL